MRKLKFYLVLNFLIIFLCNSSFSKNLEFEKNDMNLNYSKFGNFIDIISLKNYEIKSLKNSRKAFDHSVPEVEDFYSSELNLKLIKRHEKEEIPSSSFKLSNLFIEGDYYQKTPLGLGLFLRGKKNLETNQSISGYEKQRLSAGIEVSLLKNRLGKTEAIQLNSQKAQRSISLINYNIEIENLCREVSYSFIDIYISQNMKVLEEQISEASYSLFKSQKKLYKQKIISKLNFLSVEADYLASRVRSYESNLELSESSQKFLNFLNLTSFEVIKPLENPSNIFSSILNQVNKIEANDLQGDLLEAKISLQSFKLDEIKNSNKSDLKFILDVYNSKGLKATSLGFRDYSAQGLSYGASLNIPFFNRVKNKEFKSILLNKESNKKKLEQHKLNYQSKKLYLKESLQKLSELMGLQKDLVKKNEQVYKSYYLKYKDGVEDFDSFLQYKNRYFTSAQETHRIEYRYLRSVVDYLLMIGLEKKICGF